MRGSPAAGIDALRASGQLRAKRTHDRGKNGEIAPRFSQTDTATLNAVSASEGIDLMYVSKTRLVIGTSLMALTFGMLGAGTAYAFQEHMFNARNDLQQAINELNQAEHDKGGHRENAVGLVQQAINQVNQGIVAGGGTP
jgi:hypothetical protein